LQAVTEIFHQSVSLVHRCWDEGLSEAENLAKFGRDASSAGIGNDLVLSVEVEGGSLTEGEVRSWIRSSWDHQDLRHKLPVGSLEELLWEFVHQAPKPVLSVTLKTRSPLTLIWTRQHVKSLSLIWRRPFSVLLEEGGGARWNLDFHFQNLFQAGQGVLLKRKKLEGELEDWAQSLEKNNFKTSRNVKDLEQMLDAMFNSVKKISPDLQSIACETVLGRKRLIHEPIST